MALRHRGAAGSTAPSAPGERDRHGPLLHRKKRMTRDGFALLATLWLTVALAVVLSGGVIPAALAADASENRIAETRARWAAWGCVAALQARYSDRDEIGSVLRIDLGATTHCRTESQDWDERINPNVVDSAGLWSALGDSVVVASLLDWIDADTL